MDVKAGDILVIKTTGELVYILDVTENQSIVNVRRAVMSENKSINHVIDSFFIEELETGEQHLEREAGKARLQMKFSHMLDRENAELERQELQEVINKQEKEAQVPKLAGKIVEYKN